jgi:hypothetical protein
MHIFVYLQFNYVFRVIKNIESIYTDEKYFFNIIYCSNINNC